MGTEEVDETAIDELKRESGPNKSCPSLCRVSPEVFVVTDVLAGWQPIDTIVSTSTHDQDLDGIGGTLS
jgi:hypothetical protein